MHNPESVIRSPWRFETAPFHIADNVYYVGNRNVSSHLFDTGEGLLLLDTGYMAVIPWVGANTPYLDEELHRFDLPGDYWVPDPGIIADPEEAVKKFGLSHICGDRMYDKRDDKEADENHYRNYYAEDNV